METLKLTLLLFLVFSYSVALDLPDNSTICSVIDNITLAFNFDNDVFSAYPLNTPHQNTNQIHGNYEHAVQQYESQPSQSSNFENFDSWSFELFVQNNSHASSSSQPPIQSYIQTSDAQSYNNIISQNLNQSEHFNQQLSTSLQNIHQPSHQINKGIRNQRKRPLKTAEELTQNKANSNRESQARTRFHNQKIRDSHASNDQLIRTANQEFLRGGNPETILRQVLIEYTPTPAKPSIKNKASSNEEHLVE